MNKIDFKYSLNEVPSPKDLILLGLQWLVITIPIVIIIGGVVAGIHFDTFSEQVIYLQKLFFVTAVTVLMQVYWGHGLPLIVGPATVLLVGITSSQAGSIDSVYFSIMVCGLVLAVLSITGLFDYLKKLFTPRVVAGTLILIAFTLTPMITDLVTTTMGKGTGFLNLIFSLAIIFAMFAANRFLSGIWKSTLNIWAILLGTLIYNFLFSVDISGRGNYGFAPALFSGFTLKPTFETGTIISFLICFLALAVNDLGSIQSVNQLIDPGKGKKRVTRGITVTGLGNILSGFFGVIGPVNFSLSPGVIVSTRCASRYTLVPMGLGLLAISFFPGIIAFMGAIPPAVIGAILIYIMCSQIAAGLTIALNSSEEFAFEHGLVIGLSLMLSIIVSFLPQDTLNTFPLILRPILGNGFVVGVISLLVMERLIGRNNNRRKV
ncbi:MAG: purine/pyrimidine permease [Clostridium sp.]|nr:purine/pyrimidine permease [Clostridium sp.]